MTQLRLNKSLKVFLIQQDNSTASILQDHYCAPVNPAGTARRRINSCKEYQSTRSLVWKVMARSTYFSMTRAISLIPTSKSLNCAVSSASVLADRWRKYPFSPTVSVVSAPRLTTWQVQKLWTLSIMSIHPAPPRCCVSCYIALSIAPTILPRSEEHTSEL